MSQQSKGKVTVEAAVEIRGTIPGAAGGPRVLEDGGSSAMCCYPGPVDAPNIDRIVGPDLEREQAATMVRQ